MAFVQHFFLRKELIAVSEASPFFVHEKVCAPYGRAFFCPFCSEVWATVTVEGQPTHVHNAFCEKHEIGDKKGNWNFGSIARWQIPGSLWLSYDDDWNKRLPKEILNREILLTIKHREKELGPLPEDCMIPSAL